MSVAGSVLMVLIIVDLWPGSGFLIGNILQTDEDVRFHFSGRFGEVRLSRSGFHFDESVLEPSFEE